MEAEIKIFISDIAEYLKETVPQSKVAFSSSDSASQSLKSCRDYDDPSTASHSQRNTIPGTGR